MADEVVDPLGQAFRRQRKAVVDGQFLLWRGMILHRQVDEVLLTGLETQTDTAVSTVETAAAGVRTVLDPIDRLLTVNTDGQSTVRESIDRPLEVMTSAAETVGDQTMDAAERWAAQVEDEVRERILRLNSRLNDLMESHERIEQQLRDVAGQYDDPTGVSQDLHDRLTELGERVAELREHVAELHAKLDG